MCLIKVRYRRENTGLWTAHPAVRGLSMGCITLLHKSDFQLIRTLLRHTNKVSVPRAGGLLSYGTIEVIGNGDSCS